MRIDSRYLGQRRRCRQVRAELEGFPDLSRYRRLPVEEGREPIR